MLEQENSGGSSHLHDTFSSVFITTVLTGNSLEPYKHFGDSLEPLGLVSIISWLEATK